MKNPPENAKQLRVARIAECEGKRQYPDGWTAVTNLLSMAKRPDIDVTDFSVYACRFCFAWHVGGFRHKRKEMKQFIEWPTTPRPPDPSKMKGALALFSIKDGKVVVNPEYVALKNGMNSRQRARAAKVARRRAEREDKRNIPIEWEDSIK